MQIFTVIIKTGPAVMVHVSSALLILIFTQQLVVLGSSVYLKRDKKAKTKK